MTKTTGEDIRLTSTPNNTLYMLTSKNKAKFRQINLMIFYAFTTEAVVLHLKQHFCIFLNPCHVLKLIPFQRMLKAVSSRGLVLGRGRLQLQSTSLHTTAPAATQLTPPTLIQV